MSEIAENFLNEHQLKSWLPQIVDALHDRNGQAHVEDIASSPLLSERRRQNHAVRETITRTVNDFCSDAGDLAKDPPAAGDPRDVFQKVAPATYRLRGFPKKPNVCDLVRIEFDDERMDRTWRMFTQIVGRNPASSSKWETMSQETRIRRLRQAPGLRKRPGAVCRSLPADRVAERRRFSERWHA